MAKQKRGRQGRGPGGGGAAQRPAPVGGLDQETVNELVALLEQGQFIEAILAMEELREELPRDAILYKLLGMAYSEVGDLRSAAERWEEATRLDPGDPSLWRLLTGVYLGQGRPAHALRAVRRYLDADPEDEDRAEVETLRRTLEESLAAQSRIVGASPAETERGSLLLEQGLRAMEGGDFLDATRRFRDAGRVLPGWNAPQNNLALCQFQLGNADAAIATTRGVLEKDPRDVHALANLTLFLTVLGRREEALPPGERLWQLAQEYAETVRGRGRDGGAGQGQDQGPEGLDTLVLLEKAAYGLTALERDDRVIAALEGAPRDAMSDVGLLLLGVALANTGRRPAAQEVLQELGPHPRASRIAAALRLNETPPGGRFLALGRDELLPGWILSDLVDKLDPATEGDDEARRAALREMVGRFPTFLPVFMAELWLGDELDSARAVATLLAVGTPEAHDALRGFAFGRLGPDDTRLHAALALREAGQIDAAKPLLLWQDGRYQELYLPRYELAEEAPAERRPYPPPIAKLMGKALERHGRQDLDGAARLYRQVLAQAPGIADAEQHLGLIEIMRGDVEAAERHLERALALDLDSVVPRCTLASLRISQGKPAEARDLLLPLADRTRFRPSELVSYLFTTAELAAAEGDGERARGRLRLLLAYIPTHTAARLRLRQLEAEEAARRQGPAQGQQQGQDQDQGAGQLIRPASGLWTPGMRE